MIVRLLCGPDAGEVRNLPFIAARGAIRSGTAELVPDPGPEPVAVEAPPLLPEPVDSADADHAEVLHSTERTERTESHNHHKRPGRRR